MQVPDCYRHSPARLQPGYLSKFQVDTLFYIFYSMPNDEAQVLAADELRSRGWLFHKEFKVRSLLLLNHPLPISPALSIRGRDYVVGWNRPSVGDWVMHVLLLNSISHNAILQSAMLGSQHEKCGACASCDFDA